MMDAVWPILEPLWPVLVVAALFGLAFGALGWRELPVSRRGRLALGLVAALVVGGLVVALAKLVPGRPGLYLEIAVALCIAYLGGCAMGAALRALWSVTLGRAGTASPPA